MFSIKNKLRNSILVFLLLWSVIASFTRKHANETNWYHSTLWADKAGYYIYLPSVFLYQFNYDWANEDFSSKFGDGFRLIGKDRILTTKYPYGVSLLQLPFFLIAHLLALIFKYPPDGFSLIYNKLIDISCIVYFLIGAFFLWRSLEKYFKQSVLAILFLFLFFCTNLRYYITIDTGLSHIYSFFLLSSLLYFTQMYFTYNSQQTINFIIIVVIISLIFIVRPINSLFLPLFLILDLNHFDQLKYRIKKLFKLKYSLYAVVIFISFLLPQICYNYYSIGRITLDSYTGETFSNAGLPEIARVLFAFENGFFAYNPLYILAIVGMFLMIRDLNINGFIVAFLFFGLTLLYASWSSPQLGCGFGHRGYVDFYPLLIMPMGTVIEQIISNNKLMRCFIFLFIINALYYYKMEHAWDICWFGDGPWDIKYWFKLLTQ